MRRRSLSCLALLLAAALAPAPARAVDRTPQQAIESRLMCYCGCADLTVRACTCGTAEAIRGEIAERLARGETADRVIAAFVARHGEKILSAPTKEGFNLVAWVTPFAALLLAGGLLVVIVRRWGTAGAAASGRTAGEGATPPPGDADRDLLKRVERDLREDR